MNDHDRDLVTALAEGQLYGQAMDAARVRIDNDPELAAEYALQVAAVEYLSSAPAAEAMTSQEKAALNTSLIEQLGLQPAQPTPVTKRGVPWRQSLFGLAAAAAMVVAAVIIVPGQMSADDRSTAAYSSSRIETDSEATTTVVADAPIAESGATMEAAPQATDSLPLDQLLAEAYLRYQKDGSSPSDDLSTTGIGSFDIEEMDGCLAELTDDYPEETTKLVVLGTGEDAAGLPIAHVGIDHGEGLDEGITVDLTSCTVVAKTP